MNAISPRGTLSSEQSNPGYIFPMPSPYTQAQQNWLAHKMWSDAADRATDSGHIHHRALDEMAKLRLLPMEPVEELSLREWAAWRDLCQRAKAKMPTRNARLLVGEWSWNRKPIQ